MCESEDESVLLRARVAELEAALRLFAAEARRRSWITNLSEASGLDDMNVGGTRLTNGDLRRAAAVLGEG
ncbi:MAG TPA: hypothetical protein VM529_16415 [Gemmata sp.]|jgi:hypothetical protein|nr:hypothetical protein [Gemmata sp.]